MVLYMERKQSDNILNTLEENTLRIERKIILKKGQSIFFKFQLFYLGFKKTFQKRLISSIYFDDIDMTSLRDNIDGNHNRNKIRVRFYDNNLSSCTLEIKQKRGLSGYKKRIELDTQNVKNIKDVIKISNKWLLTNLSKRYFPTSIISYERCYFENGSCRATLDTEIQSKRLSISGKPLFSFNESYEVIEFKYKNEFDASFRKLFGKFQRKYARSTKSSKYANSLMN